MIRSLCVRLLALCLLLPAAAGAAEAWQYPLADDAGIVQELDFGAQSMVIDGMRYAVAVDVKVEIGGSFGAFTLLEKGMRVYYEFRRISDSERVVTLVRELPADVVLKGV